jgi:hypothetical protein
MLQKNNKNINPTLTTRLNSDNLDTSRSQINESVSSNKVNMIEPTAALPTTTSFVHLVQPDVQSLTRYTPPTMLISNSPPTLPPSVTEQLPGRINSASSSSSTGSDDPFNDQPDSTNLSVNVTGGMQSTNTGFNDYFSAEELLEQERLEEEQRELKQLLEYGLIIGNAGLKTRVNSNITAYVSRNIVTSVVSQTDKNGNSMSKDRSGIENSPILFEHFGKKSPSNLSINPPNGSNPHGNQFQIERYDQQYLYTGDMNFILTTIQQNNPESFTPGLFTTHHLDNLANSLHPDESIPNHTPLSPKLPETFKNMDSQYQINQHAQDVSPSSPHFPQNYPYSYNTLPSRLDYLFHVPAPRLEGYGRKYIEQPWCFLCCVYRPYDRTRPARITLSHPFEWDIYDESGDILEMEKRKMVLDGLETKHEGSDRVEHSDEQDRYYNNNNNNNNDGLIVLGTPGAKYVELGVSSENYKQTNSHSSPNPSGRSKIENSSIYTATPQLRSKFKSELTVDGQYIHAIHHHYRHRRGCCFIRSKYTPTVFSTFLSTVPHESPPLPSSQSNNGHINSPTMPVQGNIDLTQKSDAICFCLCCCRGKCMPSVSYTDAVNGAELFDLPFEQTYFSNELKEQNKQFAQSEKTQKFGEHRNDISSSQAPLYGDTFTDQSVSHTGIDIQIDPNSSNCRSSQNDHYYDTIAQEDFADGFFGTPLCYSNRGFSLCSAFSTTSTARYENLYIHWRDAFLSHVNHATLSDILPAVLKQSQDSINNLDNDNTAIQNSLLDPSELPPDPTPKNESTSSNNNSNNDNSQHASSPTTFGPQERPSKPPTPLPNSFFITTNAKFDVIVHSDLNQTLNPGGIGPNQNGGSSGEQIEHLRLTRAINVRQTASGLYVVVPPPHILDVYHLPSLEGDQHQFSYGFMMNSVNNYYSIRDDVTLPSYLRLHDLKQHQLLQYQQEIDGKSPFSLGFNRFFQSTNHIKTKREQQRLYSSGFTIDTTAQGDNNPNNSNNSNNHSDDSSIDGDSENQNGSYSFNTESKLQSDKVQQNHDNKIVYPNVLFSDDDIIKFDPQLYHINIITDYKGYLRDYICTSFLPSSNTIKYNTLIDPNANFENQNSSSAAENTQHNNPQTSPKINFQTQFQHSKLYKISIATPNTDPFFQQYATMYRNRFIRLIAAHLHCFPHLKTILSPRFTHAVLIIKHLSSPTHQIMFSHNRSDNPNDINNIDGVHNDTNGSQNSPKIEQQEPPPDAQLFTTSPSTHQVFSNKPKGSIILPHITSYDTTKFLSPPTPQFPFVLPSIIYNILPISPAHTRLPQLSHKVAFTDYFLGRPRISFWPYILSRNIYLWAWSTPYDDEIVHFRHRLLLLLSVVLFNLSIFISFSTQIEKLVNWLISIVTKAPVVGDHLGFLPFVFTTSLLQAIFVGITRPFLAFTMFDCYNMQRSYRPTIRVLGYVLYFTCLAIALTFFIGSLLAFGLVLFTHRCDLILQKIIQYYLGYHLYSVCCVVGIPSPLYYFLMNAYGSVPTYVQSNLVHEFNEKKQSDEKLKKEIAFIEKEDPESLAFQNEENQNDQTNNDQNGAEKFEPKPKRKKAKEGEGEEGEGYYDESTDLLAIKRQYIQAGVSLGIKSGALVVKSVDWR